MVLGNLIINLHSEKERAAYVTRELSVEDKKVRVLFQKHMHTLLQNDYFLNGIIFYQPL